MKLIHRIYNYCINYLSKHTGLAIFLSHGGIHFFVLIILIVLSIVLFNQTKQYEKMNLSNIKIDIVEADYMQNFDFTLTGINGDIYLNETDISDGVGKEEFKRSKGTTDLSFTFESIMEDRFKKFYNPDTLNVSTNITVSVNEDRNDLNHIRLSKGYNGKIESLAQNRNVLEFTYKTRIDTIFDWYQVPIKFSGDDIYKKKEDKSPTTAIQITFNMRCYLDMPDSIFSGNLTINYGNHYGLYDLEDEPYIIKYIFPEPDIITPYEICYRSSKSQKALADNGGIYLIIEDINAKNIVSRKSLQFSVLIGAMIAFMLDIIVNLILKWRRLAKSRKESLKTITTYKENIKNLSVNNSLTDNIVNDEEYREDDFNENL